MRWLLYTAVVFLAGCQGTVLPRDRNFASTKVDNPCLTIPEQQQRSRDRLAIPTTSTLIAPGGPAQLTGPYNP